MYGWRHGRSRDVDDDAGIRSVDSNILHVAPEQRERDGKTIICWILLSPTSKWTKACLDDLLTFCGG